MSDRFDLEQEILQCWQLLDDVKLIYSNTDNFDMKPEELDRLQNQLLGLMSLGELRFNKLWATFESGVNQRWITNNPKE